MPKSVKSFCILSTAMIIIFLTASFSFSQLVNDFRVNDDSTSNTQDQASFGVDKTGNFVIVWRDWRNSNEEIYCQLFNSFGQNIGSNFRLVMLGHSPTVAVSKNGSFGLCWIDTVPKFRLYDIAGVPLSNIIIVDSSYYPQAHKTSISCDSSGNFVVAFEKKVGTNIINIHFQLIDSLGNKIGGNTRVNDDFTQNLRHQYPDVVKRKDGSFIITWQDPRPPAVFNGEDIYMQIFDNIGNRIGNNVRVNNDTVMLDYQYLPKITTDDAGRFCIVFIQVVENTLETYNLLQLYNSDGTPNGNNIRFSSVSNSEQYPLISKRGNGDMVVCFRRDAVSQYVPYIQRILSNGTNLGNPFLVTDYYTTSGKVTSSICLFNDKIITVWNDNRFGNQDVFFNIRSFIKPDSVAAIRNVSTLKPDKFSLHQNYPNPFNSVSKIKFEIAKLSDVSVVVYDILGKEVSSLVNEKLKPGTYETFFDGGSLSSGIYFCRLIVNSEQKDFKKMILIK